MKALKSIQIISTLVVLFSLTIGVSFAQNYRMQANSDIKIEGTSNIHDWEMEATSKAGGLAIETENGKLSAIKNLQVSIPAESLRSGKSGMDKNAYKALNTDKHKNIEFKLKEVKKIEETGNNTYKITTTGNLIINGTSKEIPLVLTAKMNGSNIELTGEHKLNMTQYKVDPPTALMGTVKTGEEITVKFKTNFSK